MTRFTSKFRLLAAVSTLSVALALPGHQAAATGIPVFDGASVTQLIAEFQQQLKDYEKQIEQLQTMRASLEEQIKQVEELRRQVSAITGSRAISSVLNGDIEKAARQVFAHNVNGAISEVMGGRIEVLTTDGNLAPGVNPEGLARDMLRRLDFDLDELAVLSASESPQDRGIAHEMATGVVLSVAAQDAAVRAENGLGAITDLVDRIDTMPDIKGSTDLNTRMTAEVGFRLVELLRLTSAQATAAGNAAVVVARDREAQSKYSVFNDNAATADNPEGAE